jgi:DNA (cytosine-5)-methyltransferase 1
MAIKLKYVDLFAGIGGFAAAFTSLGAECASAVEKDKAAAATYKLNWGHEALGNVVDSKNPDKSVQVGPHDILTAGFPCQPFSKSGSQDGVLDKSRGTLFNNILQIIGNLEHESRPTIVVLENVRNLAGPKHAADLEIIKASLRHLGYTVEEQNLFLSPHRIRREFGGRPQNRERIFIVGTKLPESLSGKPTKKLGYTDKVLSYLSGLKHSIYDEMQEFLIDEDPRTYWKLSRDLPISDGTQKEVGLKHSEEIAINLWDSWKEAIRVASGKLPGFPVWTSYWKEDPEIPDDCPNWKRKFIEKNVQLFKDNQEICQSLLDSFELHQLIPTYRKFEWQAGDMPSIWKGVIHFRPSGIRVKQANYLPALVAITHTPVIGPERRRISIQEAAFLQGFPSNFCFDSDQSSQHFKQLGNAVNVAAVLVVLKSLAARDEAVLKMTTSGRQILSAVSKLQKSPDEYFATWEPSGSRAK